jgi:hypothetical protein
VRWIDEWLLPFALDFFTLWQNDAQHEIVNVRFRKIEEDLAEVRQELQDLKKEVFKPAA